MQERPVLLILHEPAAGLDVETGRALSARYAVAVRATVSEHNCASVPPHPESGSLQKGASRYAAPTKARGLCMVGQNQGLTRRAV